MSPPFQKSGRRAEALFCICAPHILCRRALALLNGAIQIMLQLLFILLLFLKIKCDCNRCTDGYCHSRSNGYSDCNSYRAAD